MAINYSVKMKSKKLDEKVLIKAFEKFGLRSKNIEILSEGICMDFFEELGFYVYLTDGSNYPYNSWITKFGEEFVFERTLEFRFNKEYKYLEKRYSIMVAIVFELMLSLGEEAIFINNDDKELCLFKENGEVLLNNEDGIWNQNYFKDIILNNNQRNT
ncbi:hypothetical protein D3Z58_24430 [Clostridiaceae bacterium]|nr:hypothetical protein [Clostridiaceae bacterium]